jgi:hypothetical protein
MGANESGQQGYPIVGHPRDEEIIKLTPMGRSGSPNVSTLLAAWLQCGQMI